MTAKEKVLKIEPDCMANMVFYQYAKKSVHYQILKGVKSGNVKSLSTPQSRESWAWAEALRNLQSKSI